jgi:phage terminase large subunit
MARTGDTPLDNPRWERYCQLRAEGTTQRQAMLAAWPGRSRWKPETVDSRASELEAKGLVKGRIRALKRAAAERAVISRAEVLSGMCETFEAGVGRVRDAEGKPLDYAAVNAVTQLGKTLMDAIPEEEPEDEAPRGSRDFALLIGPDFLRPHRLMVTEAQEEFWCRGGRGSLKSSWASLELVRHVESHPHEHAAAVMKRKTSLRDAVYAQVVWAIHALGLDDEYETPVSTMRIRKKSTGQLILFAGCDDPHKTKGLKPPFGHIGFVWFEETDQFRGMAEIRTVLQSVARGGDRTVRVYTYNPPRTRDNWANREADRRAAAGEEVFDSCYTDAPPEWLGAQFLDDAEALREADEQAYRHEYLGEPVGYGGQIFDRVEFREVTDEEIASFDRLKAGQDFGWFPDPWAFTLSEWQPGRHTLVTFRELGGNKVLPRDAASAIRDALTWPDRDEAKPAYHRLRVLSDDAAPDQIEAQREEGVDARPSGKGGRREMSYRFLQSVRWVIDPRRCPNLAREVREATFELDDRTGEYSGDYPDGNDHWIDATRYALMDVVTRRGAYRFAGKEPVDG